jgi:hypothetical protein
MVGYAIMAARAALMADRNIVIAPDHVSVPDSFLSRSGLDIPFSDITGLSLQTGRNLRVLHVRHQSGTTKATQRFFEGREHFDDFLAQLQKAVQAAQSHPV